MVNKIIAALFLTMSPIVTMQTHAASETTSNEVGERMRQQLEEGVAQAAPFRASYPNKCFVSYTAMRYGLHSLDPSYRYVSCSGMLVDLHYMRDQQRELEGRDETYIEGLSIYNSLPSAQSSSGEAIASFATLPLSAAIKTLEHMMEQRQ